MEPKYATLKTIYEIVKDKPSPKTYHCTPRQIILHQMNPWDNIMQNLEELADEGLIVIRKLGASLCITEKGIEKAKSTGIIADK